VPLEELLGPQSFERGVEIAVVLSRTSGGVEHLVEEVAEVVAGWSVPPPAEGYWGDRSA
jgi:hypothetical protein